MISSVGLEGGGEEDVQIEQRQHRRFPESSGILISDICPSDGDRLSPRHTHNNTLMVGSGLRRDN